MDEISLLQSISTSAYSILCVRFCIIGITYTFNIVAGLGDTIGY